MMYHEADLDGVRYIILHDKGDADDDAVEGTRLCLFYVHYNTNCHAVCSTVIMDLKL